jgi:hypothetical protein
MRTFWSTRSQRGRPRGPKETWWRRPLARPRHLGPFQPWSCDAVYFHPRLISLTYKRLYKDPQGVLTRRRRRNTKQQNRGCPSEDWMGKRCRSRPGRFSNLSDITAIATIMKREYSTSGLWVCGCSLFYFSLMLWLFRCRMRGPTWLWHILCNSYMVDPYLIGWSMLYSICMSRCILFPRSLLLVLIQHVCEGARGGWCVLDGVNR